MNFRRFLSLRLFFAVKKEQSIQLGLMLTEEYDRRLEACVHTFCISEKVVYTGTAANSFLSVSVCTAFPRCHETRIEPPSSVILFSMCTYRR